LRRTFFSSSSSQPSHLRLIRGGAALVRTSGSGIRITCSAAASASRSSGSSTAPIVSLVWRRRSKAWLPIGREDGGARAGRADGAAALSGDRDMAIEDANMSAPLLLPAILDPIEAPAKAIRPRVSKAAGPGRSGCGGPCLIFARIQADARDARSWERDMNLAFLLSLQAAATPAPPAARIGATDFDLAKVRRSASPIDVHSLFGCDRSGGADIVVCARRAGPAYPLEEMARIFEAGPLRAETGLGSGLTGNIHVEDVEFPGGLHSHRIMIGVKMPF
jgi:hypothetical protein